MGRKYSTKDIVLDYLVNMKGREFSSHEFENEIVEYGRKFQVLHTASTYSRAFRDIKETQDIPGNPLNRMRIKVMDVSGRYANRADNTWVVVDSTPPTKEGEGLNSLFSDSTENLSKLI